MVVAAGTLWLAQWTRIKSLEASERQRTANEQLLQKSDRITDLQERLRVSQEDLRVAQDKLSTSYSGGDSFCYVDIYPTLHSPDPFAMHFVLRHVGANMLSDIRVKLLDMKSPGLDVGKVFELSTLSRGDTRALTELTIKPLTVDLYGVRISARNGTVSQDIRIFRLKNHWSRSLKVWVKLEHDQTFSPETRDALATAITQQSVAVAGKDVKVHFEVADGGKVQFERTDADFPK